MLTEHRTSSVKRLTGRLYQSLVAVVVYILCSFLLELSVNELINIFVFFTSTLFLFFLVTQVSKVVVLLILATLLSFLFRFFQMFLLKSLYWFSFNQKTYFFVVGDQLNRIKFLRCNFRAVHNA